MIPSRISAKSRCGVGSEMRIPHKKSAISPARTRGLEILAWEGAPSDQRTTEQVLGPHPNHEMFHDFNMNCEMAHMSMGRWYL